MKNYELSQTEIESLIEKNEIDTISRRFSNATQSNKDYGLQLAAEHNLIETMDTLIKLGADIEGNKGSVLFMACDKGALEAVNFLIEKGANPKGLKDCNKPIFYADKNKHKEVVALLKSHGADLKKVRIKKEFNQTDIKEFVTILKKLKDMFPEKDEIQDMIKENIEISEKSLDIFPEGPRKPDMKFDKFLSSVINLNPQDGTNINKKPKM